MAQNKPWEADPVVSQTPQRGQDIYIPPAGPTPEEQASAARAQRGLDLQEQAAERAAQGEARAQAEFEGTGGKPTEAQAKASVLLTRIKGGFADIQGVRERNPEAQEAGLAETVSRGIFGDGLVSRKIAGADRRIVSDAELDILDGLLTLGTGAAYTREQLAGQRASYFPQYGDSDQEIAIKNQRMVRLIESAKINAGPKWAEVESAIAPFMPKADGSTAGLQVAEGETYSTDEDLDQARKLTDAWRGGATIEQIQSMMRPGESLTPADIERLQADKDRALPFGPASSGRRNAGGPGTAAAIGSGMLKGYTGNMAEEIAGLVSPDAAAKLQAAGAFAQETAPVTSFLGELAGGIVSPLARLPLGRAGTVAGEGMRGAAYGGIYGAGEAAPGMGIEDRIASGAIGAVTGGAGGALAGRLMRGGSGAPNQAVAAAQDLNIPVMTSDVAQPSTFMGRSAQQVGERIPFAGTSGLRSSQQQARTDAVTELLTDYGVGDPALARKVQGALSRTRKAEIDKYVQMKRDVIAPLSSAGEVPVTGAAKAIDDEIARLERISPQGFAPATSILRRWKSDIAGKSLDDLEVLRRQVGEEFAAPELAAVSGEAQKSLNRIYGPLREDMGNFIRANGAPRDFAKWQVANKRLAEGMGELGKTALRTALRDGEQTPEVVLNMLFSSKPSDVASLYRNLDQQGRATARAAIVDKVFRDMGGQIDEVTPEKFLRDIRKQGSQVRIFFSGDEAKRLEGLVSALKLTRRAGEAPVLTASGQQTYLPVGIAALADIFGTGGAALAGGASIGAMARAYESGPVRNAIMRLQNSKPADQSKAAQNVIAALRTAMGQTGANASPQVTPVTPTENIQ